MTTNQPKDPFNNLKIGKIYNFYALPVPPALQCGAKGQTAEYSPNSSKITRFYLFESPNLPGIVFGSKSKQSLYSGENVINKFYNMSNGAVEYKFSHVGIWFRLKPDNWTSEMLNDPDPMKVFYDGIR
jgi:hypothetical protein